MMTIGETRFVRCDDCWGEGVIRYGHPNAPYDAREERCEICRGQGVIEVEVEPITLDDLADQPLTEYDIELAEAA